MQNIQTENQNKFECFIDLMLEIFKKERIQPLILNGFDDWTQLQQIKMEDLLEIKYSKQEAQSVLNCINSIQRNEFHSLTPPSYQMQQQKQRQSQQKQEEQQQQLPLTKIPEFQDHPLTTALLMKGTTNKPTTKTSGNFLSTIAMINLQQKKITKICHLEQLKSLQILHLSSNCITKMQGLQKCLQLKTLKLDYNYITKIQGLETLENLNKLILNHNMIRVIEGISTLYSLIELNISDQQIPSGLKFYPGQLQAVGQSLEVLFCNNNKITNIEEFKYLKVVVNIEMKNNQIKDVSALAAVLPHMQRIKNVKFIGNPVIKAPKYRDYLVILAKSMQQVDNKKILPSQRQYLVKLYSLKHAKQQIDIKAPIVKAPKFQGPQITINKLQGQLGVAHKLNTPTDFHNNTAYKMSKRATP